MSITTEHVLDLIDAIDNWGNEIRRAAEAGQTVTLPDADWQPGLAEIVSDDAVDGLVAAVGRWAVAESVAGADPGPVTEAAAIAARAVWAGPLTALVP